MLPSGATEISKALFTQALIYLKTCPPTLYDEVALSGSVARGVADQYSDCEVAFWVTELQSAAAYKAWLESLGSEVKLMRESPDGEKALYLEYNIDGVKLGTIWQTWQNLDEVLTALSNDRLPTRESDVWMLSNLIPIGDAPRLRTYKRSL